MDERLSLSKLIRDKLDTGRLPRVLPDKMLTGYGHSGPCDGCDQPIYPPQVEYKFAIKDVVDLRNFDADTGTVYGGSTQMSVELHFLLVHALVSWKIPRCSDD